MLHPRKAERSNPYDLLAEGLLKDNKKSLGELEKSLDALERQKTLPQNEHQKEGR